ncbi:glutathione S-transferase family protein [Gilvimarinus sp. F26214L]|uniref:glutathione S-transferase family protein n=1 Tax=Gilvimarinus sp. DZF01 TaxID=3461371 RepID=UPI004045CD1D
MKLIIGNKNYSSWSLRAWLLLTYHKLGFEEIRIPLDQPTTRDQIARYSKAGRVPVLHDGDLVVWDSLAICEYVSERYLAGRGWPGHWRARAEARSYSAEMHSGFPAVRSELPMNCRASDRKVPVSAQAQTEIQRIEEIWTACRARYGMEGPFLFGEFSIADCMYAPLVFRFQTYGIALRTPAADYMSYLLREPALRKWLQDARSETETIAAEERGI